MIKARIEVLDENGKVIHEQEMKSFLYNFAAFVRANFANDSNQTYRDTGGTWRSNYVQSVFPVKKIMVGSDNTSVSAYDYKLLSPFTEGIGDGKVQLSYPYVSWGIPSYNKSTVVVGGMASNTGSTNLQIGEVGILVWMNNDSSYQVLIARDVFNPKLDFPAYSNRTFVYYIDFPV